MTCSLLRITTIACLFASSAFAAVLVPDSQIILYESSVPSSDYELTIFQTPESGPNGDFTGIIFSVDSSPNPGFALLTFDNANVDESSDWYSVTPNQPFTQATIDNGTNTLWGGVDSNGNVVIGGSLEVPIGTFFLGANTGVGFDPNFAPFRDVFGWASLSVDSNLDIQLLDSAVAYQCGGIIVGQNVVPEPSCSVILLAFLPALVNLVERRRKATKRGITSICPQ